jgi:hypothetical protein
MRFGSELRKMPPGTNARDFTLLKSKFNAQNCTKTCDFHSFWSEKLCFLA